MWEVEVGGVVGVGYVGLGCVGWSFLYIGVVEFVGRSGGGLYEANKVDGRLRRE